LLLVDKVILLRISVLHTDHH